MFKLNSDFKDFYDDMLDNSSKITYNRVRGQEISRVDDLNFLKSVGIKTVKFGPFRNFGLDTKRFVVYTNQFLHDSLGKHIYTFEEVSLQYNNNLLAEFIENTQGYTVKYLQIGERRFRLMFHNPDFDKTLTEGKLVNFDELPRQYNYGIGLPIYSIDYISTGSEMLAIDFNRVQKLDTIGVKEFMSADEIIIEIKNALIAYNKA